MTPPESQESAEVTCDNCEHLFISNLGITVLANETLTSPDGSPQPYLHFCSPECSDEWHAKHA
jgi:hypothetical protein